MAAQPPETFTSSPVMKLASSETRKRAQGATRFRQMSMDERWVVRDPAAMYRTFPWFHGEGFDLLVEDLRRLAADRIVLVEGFRLLPELVRPLLSDLEAAL